MRQPLGMQVGTYGKTSKTLKNMQINVQRAVQIVKMISSAKLSGNPEGSRRSLWVPHGFQPQGPICR